MTEQGPQPASGNREAVGPAGLPVDVATMESQVGNVLNSRVPIQAKETAERIAERYGIDPQQAQERVVRRTTASSNPERNQTGQNTREQESPEQFGTQNGAIADTLAQTGAILAHSRRRARRGRGIQPSTTGAADEAALQRIRAELGLAPLPGVAQNGEAAAGATANPLPDDDTFLDDLLKENNKQELAKLKKEEPKPTLIKRLRKGSRGFTRFVKEKTGLKEVPERTGILVAAESEKGNQTENGEAYFTIEHGFRSVTIQGNENSVTQAQFMSETLAKMSFALDGIENPSADQVTTKQVEIYKRISQVSDDLEHYAMVGVLDGLEIVTCGISDTEDRDVASSLATFALSESIAEAIDNGEKIDSQLISKALEEAKRTIRLYNRVNNKKTDVSVALSLRTRGEQFGVAVGGARLYKQFEDDSLRLVTTDLTPQMDYLVTHDSARPSTYFQQVGPFQRPTGILQDLQSDRVVIHRLGALRKDERLLLLSPGVACDVEGLRGGTIPPDIQEKLVEIDMEYERRIQPPNIGQLNGEQQKLLREAAANHAFGRMLKEINLAGLDHDDAYDPDKKGKPVLDILLRNHGQYSDSNLTTVVVQQSETAQHLRDRKMETGVATLEADLYTQARETEGQLAADFAASGLPFPSQAELDALREEYFRAGTVPVEFDPEPESEEPARTPLAKLRRRRGVNSVLHYQTQADTPQIVAPNHTYESWLARRIRGTDPATLAEREDQQRATIIDQGPIIDPQAGTGGLNPRRQAEGRTIPAHPDTERPAYTERMRALGIPIPPELTDNTPATDEEVERYVTQQVNNLGNRLIETGVEVPTQNELAQLWEDYYVALRERETDQDLDTWVRDRIEQQQRDARIKKEQEEQAARAAEDNELLSSPASQPEPAGIPAPDPFLPQTREERQQEIRRRMERDAIEEREGFRNREMAAAESDLVERGVQIPPVEQLETFRKEFEATGSPRGEYSEWLEGRLRNPNATPVPVERPGMYTQVEEILRNEGIPLPDEARLLEIQNSRRFSTPDEYREALEAEAITRLRQSLAPIVGEHTAGTTSEPGDGTPAPGNAAAAAQESSPPLEAPPQRRFPAQAEAAFATIDKNMRIEGYVIPEDPGELEQFRSDFNPTPGTRAQVLQQYYDFVRAKGRPQRQEPLQRTASQEVQLREPPAEPLHGVDPEAPAAAPPPEPPPNAEAPPAAPAELVTFEATVPVEEEDPRTHEQIQQEAIWMQPIEDYFRGLGIPVPEGAELEKFRRDYALERRRQTNIDYSYVSYIEVQYGELLTEYTKSHPINLSEIEQNLPPFTEEQLQAMDEHNVRYIENLLIPNSGLTVAFEIENFVREEGLSLSQDNRDLTLVRARIRFVQDNPNRYTYAEFLRNRFAPEEYPEEQLQPAVEEYFGTENIQRLAETEAQVIAQGYKLLENRDDLRRRYRTAFDGLASGRSYEEWLKQGRNYTHWSKPVDKKQETRDAQAAVGDQAEAPPAIQAAAASLDAEPPQEADDTGFDRTQITEYGQIPHEFIEAAVPLVTPLEWVRDLDSEVIKGDILAFYQSGKPVEEIIEYMNQQHGRSLPQALQPEPAALESKLIPVQPPETVVSYSQIPEEIRLQLVEMRFQLRNQGLALPTTEAAALMVEFYNSHRPVAEFSNFVRDRLLADARKGAVEVSNYEEIPQLYLQELIGGDNVDITTLSVEELKERIVKFYNTGRPLSEFQAFMAAELNQDRPPVQPAPLPPPQSQNPDNDTPNEKPKPSEELLKEVEQFLRAQSYGQLSYVELEEMRTQALQDGISYQEYMRRVAKAMNERLIERFGNSPRIDPVVNGNLRDLEQGLKKQLTQLQLVLPPEKDLIPLRLEYIALSPEERKIGYSRWLKMKLDQIDKAKNLQNTQTTANQKTELPVSDKTESEPTATQEIPPWMAAGESFMRTEGFPVPLDETEELTELRRIAIEDGLSQAEYNLLIEERYPIQNTKKNKKTERRRGSRGRSQLEE